MSASRYRIYDPMGDEYASPVAYPSPMTPEACQAAVFASDEDAQARALELLAVDRPWLIVLPVGGLACQDCGSCFDPFAGIWPAPFESVDILTT